MNNAALRPGGQTASRSAAALKKAIGQVVEMFLQAKTNTCIFSIEAVNGGAHVSGTLIRTKKLANVDADMVGYHLWLLPNSLTFPGGREELNKAVLDACDFTMTSNCGDKTGSNKALTGQLSAAR